jgi:mono/diheme cytochrome c family protein
MLRLWCDARPNWKARLAYAIALPTSTVVVIMASHLGGSLTHGEGFLTEHAPPVLRRLLGLPETATAAAPGAADRTFYEASIQPILTSRCVACHGPEKAKGKLRLDSYAELVKGGNYGPSVVPGKPDDSELLRRVRLPLDDDDRMPPKGKPQLTPGEEAVLAWWIEAGASGTATAAALHPPPAIRSQLGR